MPRVAMLSAVVLATACALRHPDDRLARVEPPADVSAPDVAASDAPLVDAPVVDAPAVDVPAMDVPAMDGVASDAPVDAPAPDAPAEDVAPDRAPDAPDVPLAPDAPDVPDVPDARVDDVEVPCAPGLTRCAGACIDPREDPSHCGACGVACGDGRVCASGRCECAPGRGDCDGDAANGCETDLRASASHCGRCGERCPARPNGTPACVSGACVTQCASVAADCDGNADNGCETTPATDVRHCGGCGQVCAAKPNSMPTCAAGRCGFECLPGWADCNRDDADGCEAQLATNPAHCGRCDVACTDRRACVAGACTTSNSCATPRTECSGVCVDTQTDVAHCGRCGVRCAAGQQCVAGACQCPAGQTLCGTACVNATSDVRHCGGCMRACPTGATCVAGACQCPAGRTACAGACVDTRTNGAHCGRCGNACPVADACSGGSCQCGGRGQFCCWFRRCGAGTSCGVTLCW